MSEVKESICLFLFDAADTRQRESAKIQTHTYIHKHRLCVCVCVCVRICSVRLLTIGETLVNSAKQYYLPFAREFDLLTEAQFRCRNCSLVVKASTKFY